MCQYFEMRHAVKTVVLCLRVFLKMKSGVKMLSLEYALYLFLHYFIYRIAAQA